MEKKNMGNMLTKTTKIFYLYIVVLVFSAFISYSQIQAPKNLRATPTGDNKILLVWDKPDDGGVSYYRIYRSIGIDTNIWSALDDVPGNINSYIDYQVVKDVKYNYSVVAISGFVTSQRSIAFAKASTGKSVVQIESSPKSNLRVGIAYIDTVRAESDDPNARMVFSLINPPSGMQIVRIDNKKSVILWMPPQAGRYPVTVCAKNINDSIYLNFSTPGQAVQSYDIKVASDAGNIQGFVKDVNNKGIPNVSIRFYEINNDGFTYDVTTDGTGKYELNKISIGNYYVYLKAPDSYASTWYDNKTDLKSASILPVGQFLQMDFTLYKKDSTIAYVHGVVKDTLGNPILNAAVRLVDADDYLNVGKDDQSLDAYINEAANEYLTYYGFTNSNGYYEVKAPKSRSYFAFCDENNFSMAYYQNQSNAAYANKFYLDSDKNNIDFVLLPKTISNNRVDLKVLKSDINEGIESIIIFLKREQRGVSGGGKVPFKFQPADYCKTFMTDPDGSIILPGDIDTSLYYIQAIPIGSYLPTLYSSSNDESNIKWSQADSIFISGAVTGLVLKTTHEINDGLGMVTGRIISSTGENVCGAMVYALMKQQNQLVPVAYGITDSLGYFIIKGLRPANYNIDIEHYFYNEYTGLKGFTIGNDISTHELGNIIINPIYMSISGTDNPIILPNSYSLSQNYPNPFNPNTSIRYSLTNVARVEIKIYDILGREVTTLVNGIQNAGTYNVIFNAKNNSSGFYFAVIRIYQKDQLIFLDKKKMLLIK